MHGHTAAHKSLPLGTIAKVTNLENGKRVIVKINDRGPYKKGRIIDLSHAAAKSIGMLKDGTAKVKVEVIAMPRKSNLEASNRG
jgi:rare lipoprotein A